MTVHLIMGAAGSGKTTRIVRDVTATIAVGQANPNHRLLALTRMHGSRRRLTERLGAALHSRSRFVCETIDSFAWRLLRRWRAVARLRSLLPEELSFDDVCDRAADLLADRVIARWCTRRYAQILVDELQDCRGGRLSILKALSQHADLRAAADAFQDLDGANPNEAVAWATGCGSVEVLEGCHRTRVESLLAAAHALRDARSLPPGDSSFKVLGAPNKNVAASFVSQSVKWWSGHGETVLISPVGTVTSRFVRECIARVAQGPIGKGVKQAGPYEIPWEASFDAEVESLLARLQLPEGGEAQTSATSILSRCDDRERRVLQPWVDRERSTAGNTTFTSATIQRTVRRLLQANRAHSADRTRRLRILTIHQAKNREFDNVIVLWPYEIKGDLDRQRRLLYNAITRARRKAVVIVQDPKRAAAPPFA